VSKRISSVVWFSSWIIILSFEDWIDLIVPVWILGVVWARRIRSRIPRSERMKVVFWSFIVGRGYIFLNMC